MDLRSIISLVLLNRKRNTMKIPGFYMEISAALFKYPSTCNYLDFVPYYKVTQLTLDHSMDRRRTDNNSMVVVCEGRGWWDDDVVSCGCWYRTDR